MQRRRNLGAKAAEETSAPCEPAASTALQATAHFVWGEFVALYQLEFLPETWRPAFGFAVRNWLACVVALYLAFLFELDEPFWAGSTVWLVAQPTMGMAFSRSFFRVLGTVVGIGVGLAMIALFSQTPELFVLVLALWIGSCTVAANLLRNFRDYGAVMAGYTTALVSLDSYANPNQAFHIAMARGAATLIGIACSTLAASLFTQHKARDKVIVEMRKAIRVAALRAAFPTAGAFTYRLGLGRPLIASLIALDREIDFASAESAKFRIHADLARSFLAHLFGVIAAKRSLEDHLIRNGAIQNKQTIVLYDDVMRFLENAPGQLDLEQWDELAATLQELRSRLLNSTQADANLPQLVSSRIVLDRMDEMLQNFEGALADWRGIQGGWRYTPNLRLDFHRDSRAAYINGMRAFLAVSLAGAIWIESAWPNGSTMLLRITMVCSLFSTAPRPDVRNFVYFQGVLLAALAGVVLNFYLLQKVDGFPLFALVLALFLIPGAMFMTNASTAGFATAYCSYSLILSQPLNQMSYNAPWYFNNALASLSGVALGVVIYRLLMPPNPQAARRYVVWRIRRGLRNIAQRVPAFPQWAWQTRMFDRVHRLYDRSNPSATPTDEWYEGGLGALNLGNEVLRLRQLIEGGKLANGASLLAHTVLNSFSEVESNPDSTLFTIQAVIAALHVTNPPDDDERRCAWSRLLGIVQEMESFFIEHPRFLTDG